MKYRVKLSYPTAIEIEGKPYILFPDAEIQLPDSEIVQTYMELGYLIMIKENEKTKKEKSNE